MISLATPLEQLGPAAGRRCRQQGPTSPTALAQLSAAAVTVEIASPLRGLVFPFGNTNKAVFHVFRALKELKVNFIDPDSSFVCPRKFDKGLYPVMSLVPLL